MSKTHNIDIKARLRRELSAMRSEGYLIPPRVSSEDFDDLDENMSRQELRETIAMRYNYITPSGVEIDGTDALFIMNNTYHKKRGQRYVK